jgi:hypothetical protein
LANRSVAGPSPSQLGRADSLRKICNGLACCLGRLVHLGIAKAPCRSTLSYANEHRPAALFEELAPLLVMAPLRQLIARVSAGHIGIEVGRVIGQQAATD